MLLRRYIEVYFLSPCVIRVSFFNIEWLLLTEMPNKKKKGFTVCQVTPKRPAKRKQWTKDQMLAALDAVIKDGLSGNRAVVLHGVPPSTLKDRLSGHVVHGKKPGPAPYLTSKEKKKN